MPLRSNLLWLLPVVFAALGALHYPFLHLPYFWDEAGYYIPAALDLYRQGLLIPQSTLPTGHTPLLVVYLALAWRLLGFSPPVTRLAMLLVAAATAVALYRLGRYAAPNQRGREIAAWTATLLALSPMFFAQSTLAHLDLAVALFTTLAVLALLRQRPRMFAWTASLAILSKETAVVLLPIAWVFAWQRRHERRTRTWVALTLPLIPLALWAVYYHRVTGYWTGNPEYLQYNLYSTLNPARFVLSLVRRLYEILIGGFNWLLVVGAILGVRWAKQKENTGLKSPSHLRPFSLFPHHASGAPNLYGDFLWLALGVGAAYAVMLSLVGGAILPRYLLPAFPVLFLAAVTLTWQLPRPAARAVCLLAAACFVWGWFINPPYPFPFEDNLAYTDFVRLHQQAAQFLEARDDQAPILTAWPASDELTKPELGYVGKSLPVIRINGFSRADFEARPHRSFELLYLYSHQWSPSHNWLVDFPPLERLQERYFDYAPQVPREILEARFRLRLIARFERRGQWVRIYSNANVEGLARSGTGQEER